MPVLPVPRRTGVELPISGGRRATAEDFGGGGDFGGKQIQQAATAYLAESEESEARKALVASSEIRADYARRLDAAALNGEDLGKLKESMQNDLAKVGEGFQTKRGADSLALYTSNTELMYDEQANKIAVQRAGAVARLEGQKFLNSTGAILQSNPLYLGAAEKDAEAFGATLTGIRPEQRAEIVQGLKHELNMAAAVAQARIDPEGTKARLEKGEWNLNPDQRNIAINRADTEMRAKRADEAYQIAQREREERDRNDKPATREHLIVFAEARAKATAGQEKQSDPSVKRDLWMAIHAPDGDPKKIHNADAIFEAVKAGKLNTTDANQLNSLVAAQKDEQGRSFGQRLHGRLQVVAASLRGRPDYQALAITGVADDMQLEMVSRVEKAAAALRKENKDPTVLLDPDHKDYFFKPGMMKGIEEDVKQRQREALTGSLPKVANPADLKSLGLKEDDLFVAPDGQVVKVTKNMLAQASSAPKQEPFKPSGETGPRDQPMTLATWKYRKANSLPINAGLTVVNEDGTVVDPSELR
jgi:hypothetical protein